MKLKQLLFTTSLLTAVAFYACKDKSEDPDPNQAISDKCAAKNIVVTVDLTASVMCKDNGVAIIHAKGSTGFTYQLGTGSFGADSSFTKLAPGNYSVTVKDADGCTKSATFSITATGTKGPNFQAVASMISVKCNLACHNNGTDNAPIGIFSTDCKIASRSADIKFKAYDGNMGSLDANQKNTILTWINAGGGYTD